MRKLKQHDLDDVIFAFKIINFDNGQKSTQIKITPWYAIL